MNGDCLTCSVPMKNSSSDVLYGMGAGEKLGPGDTWLRLCLVAAALKERRVTSCDGCRAADERNARSPILVKAQHSKRRSTPQHQRRGHTQRRRHSTEWQWVGGRLAEVLIGMKHSSPSRRIRALSLGCSPLHVLRCLKKRRVKRGVIVALARAAESSVEAGVPERMMTRGHGRPAVAFDMTRKGGGMLSHGIVPDFCRARTRGCRAALYNGV
jgi:hypothetical protein